MVESIKNSSTIHQLTKITLEKKEDDAYRSSIKALYLFFHQDPHHIQHTNHGETARWLYAESLRPVHNGVHFYAVAKDGTLYLHHPMATYEACDSREWLSMGWLNYQWSPKLGAVHIEIDNHHPVATPSLSAFISTIYRLKKANYLPIQFQIKLNQDTFLDDHLANDLFWKQAMHALSGTKDDVSISISYQVERDEFWLKNSVGESIQISKNDIGLVEESAPKY